MNGISVTAQGADRSHVERRRLILEKYPQVRDLFGRDPVTFKITAGIFVGQLLIAAWMGWLGLSYWWLSLILAICVGAFANHANFVIIHDAIHNCVFESPLANKWTAILADLPNAFPTAMGFRCYHIKHHSHLSAYDYDADVPSRWEVEWVGNSGWRKAVWLFGFPAIQLARLSRLKGTVPIMGKWTYINIAVIAAFDLFVLWAFGPNALLYLFFSFWFSVGGLHPLSARWLQEHFAFAPDQGTFDYYGPLNKVALNIGYHNEHHDFHEIPWTRLPDLKAMAPEFYDDLRCHRSWFALLVTFIFDPTYSLGTRSENVAQAARTAPVAAPAE
ncbi:fatty acid desaturase [Methylocystis parvus]|uniref:Fatty acid desaturase n=1 Tax=Methylocystis parvus TaxID=134 RepID=A0A6B8M0Y5_9HYPH|nr:fatty acid desaturase [Methylocystis parvus]QGM96511.1 fatty acid desaturase [Methylocystis parvus]WBJ99639.1 fatty acid desaturase [Methylocystis parvus OBBP]